MMPPMHWRWRYTEQYRDDWNKDSDGPEDAEEMTQMLLSTKVIFLVSPLRFTSHLSFLWASKQTAAVHW